MKLVFYTQILVCIIFQNKTLGSFNTDFGNELYLVEERPSDSKTDLKPSENLMISLVPKIY
jgi:hypothetical protein